MRLMRMLAMVVLLAGLLGLAVAAAASEPDTNAPTAAQVQQFNQDTDSLISLVPPKYYGLVLSFFALWHLATNFGRAYVGWKMGGFGGLLAGLFKGTNAPGTGEAGANANTKMGRAALWLALLIPALLLTGCQHVQTVEHSSVQGMKGGVIVPIPWSGGMSLLELDLAVGSIKNTTAVQPVSTNRLYAPSITVADCSKSADSLTGSATGATNAMIAAGAWDKYLLGSGDSVADCATNGSIHLDGYNGFNPLAGTNQVSH